MSELSWIPDPADARGLRAQRRLASQGAVMASLAVAAGTALLGVGAGFLWGALAPRPLLAMTGHAASVVVSAESPAFITADGLFCVLSLAGGVLSGLAGYLLAVRRWGPLPMAGVLAGAVAAAFLARWVGEQQGLAAFRHSLATLPVGAWLHGSLALGATSALAFWPLAAGLTAGITVALRTYDPERPPGP